MRIFPALAGRDDQHARKRGSELDSNRTRWRGPIEIPKYKDALHMSLRVTPPGQAAFNYDQWCQFSGYGNLLMNAFGVITMNEQFAGLMQADNPNP